jgi:hypothetical protein
MLTFALMKGVFKRIGDELRVADSWVELFGLIVSSIVGFLVYSGKIPIIQESRAETSVLTAFIIFAALLLFRLGLRAVESEHTATRTSEQLHRLTGAIERVEKTILDYVPFTNAVQEIYRVYWSVQNQDDWVKEAGLKSVRRYLALLRAISEHRGFSVRSEYLALLVYSDFWEALAKQQQKCAHDKCLIVKATHSSAPRIWDNLQADSAKEHQRKFVRSGGKIVRVFLDDSLDPPGPTAQIMDEMKEAGVTVFYVQNSKTHDLTSDFLWVDNYLVTWEATPNRQYLKACYIGRPDENQLENYAEQWQHVIGREVLRRYKDLPNETKILFQSF